MKKFDVTLFKYGYVTVEAESEEEAFLKAYDADENDITWEKVFEPSRLSDIKEVCPYAHEQWLGDERFDNICTLTGFLCDKESCAKQIDSILEES